MKFFEASIETIVIRYYIMMAAVIIPFVVGYPAFALLAVPIFLSALMGISFNWSISKAINAAFEKSKRTKSYTLTSRAAA